MLHADFTRDLSNTYMLLAEPAPRGFVRSEVPETSVQTASSDPYDLKMLSVNRIPGLLPLSLDYVNGHKTYRYTITSLIPFDQYWKNAAVSEGLVRRFFSDLIEKLLISEDYLLLPEHLLLDPAYLFMCEDSPSFMTAYVPFYSGDPRSSLVRLAEHLLHLIGYADRESVVLTCRILHELQGPSTELADLAKLLSRGSDDEFSGTGSQKTDSYPENCSQKPDSCFESRSQSQNFRSQAQMPESFSGWGTSASLRNGSLRDSGPGQHFAKGSETDRNSGINPGEVPVRSGSRPETVRGRHTETAPKKKHSTSFVLYLFAVILAAAVYVLLHMQTYFVLTLSETAGCVLLIAAAFLLCVRLIGNRSARKKKNSHPADSHTIPEEDFYGKGRFQDVGNLRVSSADSPRFVPEDPVSGLPVLRVEGSECIIGSKRSLVNAAIPVKSVGSTHARVLRRNGICYLEDLRSKRGTTVNGRKLNAHEQVPLVDGAQVLFADCAYIFRPGDTL